MDWGLADLRHGHSKRCARDPGRVLELESGSVDGWFDRWVTSGSCCGGGLERTLVDAGVGPPRCLAVAKPTGKLERVHHLGFGACHRRHRRIPDSRNRGSFHVGSSQIVVDLPATNRVASEGTASFVAARADDRHPGPGTGRTQVQQKGCCRNWPAEALIAKKPALSRDTAFTIRLAQRYPNDRCRNAAICPRGTFDVGQNRSLTGGLHPRVTPAAASLSMSLSKIRSLSSVNGSPPPSSEQLSARTKNVAIVVTG